MHFVSQVDYLDRYKLRLQFDDVEYRVVDLEPYLDEGVFQPLKELSYFKQVRLNQDIDTITWPNHADFSPEFLYEIGSKG